MSDRHRGEVSFNARQWRFIAAFSVGLLVWLIVRWILLAPSATRIVVGIVFALPFALGAPLIYIGHRRTYQGLTLALAPTLVLGLTEAVANVAMRYWAIAVLLVVLLNFMLLVGYLRATRSSSPPSRTEP